MPSNSKPKPIHCVAIKWNGIVYAGALSDVHLSLAESLGIADVDENIVDGFIDCHGRFLTRTEAAKFVGRFAEAIGLEKAELIDTETSRSRTETLIALEEMYSDDYQ